MTKIFKQLARHWAVCLVVFALLFVQAYCDLSLPDYTSKIVDTGIQQGGIESPLPDTVRQSTLDALSLLMREEDAAAFQNAYTADGDVLRLRTDLTADERTALEDAVTTPDIVLYLAAVQAANTPAGQTGMGMTGLADLQASGADRNPDTETETVAPTAENLDTVCGQFAAMSQMPGFRRDAVQQQLTGAIGQLDDTVVENLKSQALLLVGLEYEAQGIAHDVQMHYLYKVGGQMLALTLLMVAVSIAVGFLASRVSAAIGRDLRRETFSSVIHFSNAEIENFSTASLITRTTNAAAHGGLCAHSGHRRCAPCGGQPLGPFLDRGTGRGFAAAAHPLPDEHGHAQVQDHADAGGPAEPRQPRGPDRHYAGACLQPRTV